MSSRGTLPRGEEVVFRPPPLHNSSNSRADIGQCNALKWWGEECGARDSSRGIGDMGC